MARPLKAGLDYFPLDVDIDKDDDIELLEGKYGTDGFCLLIKIYMKIYGDKGYFMQANEKNLTILAKRTSIVFERVTDIIFDLVKWGIFNAEMYRKYNILTSSRLQKTYFEAVGRRKSVDVTTMFLLEIPVNVNINEVNASINEVNDNIMSTLIPKGKERKGKGKERKTEPKAKKSIITFPDTLKDEKFTEVYFSWVDHKSEVNQELTDRAIEIQLKKLSSFHINIAIHIVEASIENKWKGLVYNSDEVNRMLKKVKPSDPNAKVFVEHYGWMTEAEIAEINKEQDEIENRLLEGGELDQDGNIINSKW